MKILITGSTGLLGQALVERLTRCASVIGLSRHPTPAHGEARHLVCDLTDAQATRRALRAITPDAVIHTQAMSDVDRCEREPARAQQENTQTVEHLCEALKGRAVPVFILSTDYVFDGAKGRPYDEADEPASGAADRKDLATMGRRLARLSPYIPLRGMYSKA